MICFGVVSSKGIIPTRGKRVTQRLEEELSSLLLLLCQTIRSYTCSWQGSGIQWKKTWIFDEGRRNRHPHVCTYLYLRLRTPLSSQEPPNPRRPLGEISWQNFFLIYSLPRNKQNPHADFGDDQLCLMNMQVVPPRFPLASLFVQIRQRERDFTRNWVVASCRLLRRGRILSKCPLLYVPNKTYGPVSSDDCPPPPTPLPPFSTLSICYLSSHGRSLHCHFLHTATELTPDYRVNILQVIRNPGPGETDIYTYAPLQHRCGIPLQI